ncbi:MAG: leucine-rich repeat domain-containing protein [Crocinitomicaceae bacterium]
MKTNALWLLPATLLFTACGGGEESTETEPETDAAPVEESIAYGDFMSTEEVRETERIGSLEEFNAIEDKSSVIRFVSSEYNDAFPNELLDAYNLQVLSLNVQGDLPDDLGKFKNLTTLDLKGKMTTLPESLTELEHLKVVSLDGCKDLDFNQAMDVLVQCPNLEYLSLAYMGLTEVPANIGELKNLKHLRLGNNPITTLPKSFYTLPNLSHLRLGSNEGMDYAAVLASAKTLPALSTLWLQYCGLDALPADLAEYPALTKVNWREEWSDKDADQIIATCDKEGAKFDNFDVSWNSMSGMLYDVY